MSELRDNLEAAFDGDSTTGEGSGSVSEDTSTSEGDAGTDAETEGTDEPVIETGGDVEQEIAASDESTTDVESKVEEESGAESSTEEVAASNLAPPTGWKPAIREEHWAKLPEAVQREVLRREVDIAKGMEASSEARKLQHEFNQKIGPYQAEFASRGVGAMDAFDNYLKTAYQLRHAAPAEKAQLVAGIIQQYGVGVEDLDNVLSAQIKGGQTPAAGADPNIANAINQALAPVTQFMQTYQQNQATTAATEHQSVQEEIKTFKENPANEFYMDVKDDMANLLEAAAMRSQNMTLQDAYDRAILLHNDIAEIVSKRKLQSEAQLRDAAAKTAKAKSIGLESSSPDTTTGRVNSQTNSVRGALEAAFNADAMD